MYRLMRLIRSVPVGSEKILAAPHTISLATQFDANVALLKADKKLQKEDVAQLSKSLNLMVFSFSLRRDASRLSLM